MFYNIAIYEPTYLPSEILAMLLFDDLCPTHLLTPGLVKRAQESFVASFANAWNRRKSSRPENSLLGICQGSS